LILVLAFAKSAGSYRRLCVVVVVINGG